MTFGSRGAKSEVPQWRWELDFFDTARWRPHAVRGRCVAWISATRRRRWTIGLLLSVTLLVVLPAILGAVAYARAGAEESSGSSVNSGLSWMNVRDSSGVDLSRYLFATDHGSLFHPGNTAISMIIGLEFAGWLVIVTSAIWLVGFAISFEWLNLFSGPLEGVAHRLSGQIAIPMLLTLAVTIGAFFVAWFVVRGFHAKATMQVVAMLLVAVMGPIYLAEPLADVLSSDGLLAKGRDIGISVGAGLNGNSSPNPQALVPQMQQDMADNFARRPLQVWNFGHVVDNNSSCKSAWTSAVMSGDDGQVKSGMKNCDSSAYQATREPTMGQVGTGVILLLAGTVLLLFAVYLSLKVIKAALDTVYHGFMAIFGFAAGGFIYGPTQTFLVRNVVDGFIAGARMACYTIFLAVYVLFLGDLFDEADGNVMAIFIIGGVVEIVAIFQLRRLSNSLTGGNEFVANRFALAMQGGSGGGGSGGGGGGGGGATALGMGEMGAKGAMSGLGVLATLGAFSTFSSSPLTEMLWGRTRAPLRPFARLEREQQLANWGAWSAPGFGGPTGTYVQSMMNRPQFATAAREAAVGHGGINTAQGAAAALQGLTDAGGGLDSARGALMGAGFTDERIMSHAIRSWGIVADNADDWTLADKHLGHVVAATRRAQDSSAKLARGEGNVDEVAADLATLQAATFRMRRNSPGGVTLDGGAPMGHERRFVEDYMAAPTKEKIEALRLVSEGGAGTGMLANIDQESAARMMQWVGNEHAYRVEGAVQHLMEDPSDPQRIRTVRRHLSRATDTDAWASDNRRTPWNALQPPGNNPLNPNWTTAHQAVVQRMRGQ